MPPVKLTLPALTENQRRLIESPARILYVGAGTKTGKTVGLALWVVQGLLAGERCAVVGPWFKRTRAFYDLLKTFLEVPIARQDVAAAELKFTGENGGRIDFYSGDHVEPLYGDAYHRVVIDEASRQTEASLTAALTTISATNGKVRLAFNLERGSKNWAIRHLLRVKHMTPEERAKSSEDYMLFPTLGEGFVPAELIESMRGKMPESLWRALYLAEIPAEDAALFRGLDEIFTGAEWSSPVKGGRYVMGADLARKQDWTVLTVLDVGSGKVAYVDRFNAVAWTVQVERAAALYARFGCSRAVVDATGIGDVVIEELRKAGLRVEPFIFSGPSKKRLLEGLIVAVERRAITVPEKYQWLKEELEGMEFVLSENGEVKYGSASGMSDDGVMSLALAVTELGKGGAGFFVPLAIAKYAGTSLDESGYRPGKFYENGGTWAREMDEAEAEERDRRNRFRGF